MEKVRGKDRSMNRKWKDRNRVYALSDGCSDTHFLVETERTIDRIFKLYIQSGGVYELEKFVQWMKEMELCKVIEYEEFKI